MAKEFLCDTGLEYLVKQKLLPLIDTKVNKDGSKVLSDVNFSTADKSKLDSIDLSQYALKSDISTIYRVKGTTTYAELIAKVDAEVGDVYNVSDKGGMNYVCIVAKTAGAENWDELGGNIDLSNYVEKEEGKGLSTNDFTNEYKTKLDGVEVGANKYVHPIGDGNLHVPATSTTNDGKVLMAGATAGDIKWADIPSISNGEIDALFE